MVAVVAAAVSDPDCCWLVFEFVCSSKVWRGLPGTDRMSYAEEGALDGDMSVAVNDTAPGSPVC